MTSTNEAGVPSINCRSLPIRFYNLSLVLLSRAISWPRGSLRSRRRSVLGRFRRVGTTVIVGLLVVLVASHAGSLERPPSSTKEQAPVTEAPPTVPTPAAPI